jgi:AbrB family looped-hinge helix DNA binding protein
MCYPIHFRKKRGNGWGTQILRVDEADLSYLWVKKNTYQKVRKIIKSKVKCNLKGISMPTAKMTSKGQITIPIKVRKALGLKPGVRIDFYEVGEGEYAFRAKTGSIMEMEGCLAKLDHVLTIEEMNQAVLDHAAELDAATRSDAHSNFSDGEAA